MHFQCLDSISNHSFWKLLHFQHANLWTWSHQPGHLHNLHIWTELRYSNHWEKHQKYLLIYISRFDPDPGPGAEQLHVQWTGQGGGGQDSSSWSGDMVMCVFRIFTINPLLTSQGSAWRARYGGHSPLPHQLCDAGDQVPLYLSISLYTFQSTFIYFIHLFILYIYFFTFIYLYLFIYLFLSIYLFYWCRFHRLRSPYQSSCYANWTSTNYTDYIDPKHTYSRTVRFWWSTSL